MDALGNHGQEADFPDAASRAPLLAIVRLIVDQSPNIRADYIASALVEHPYFARIASYAQWLRAAQYVIGNPAQGQAHGGS